MLSRGFKIVKNHEMRLASTEFSQKTVALISFVQDLMNHEALSMIGGHARLELDYINVL